MVDHYGMNNAKLPDAHCVVNPTNVLIDLILSDDLNLPENRQLNVQGEFPGI